MVWLRSQYEGRKASAEAGAPRTLNTEYEATGRTLKWRLQCRGQLDVDVAGQFNFDSPLHYTATITSKGRMAGALISDVKTELEGERVSDCQ